MQRQIIRKWYR